MKIVQLWGSLVLTVLIPFANHAQSGPPVIVSQPQDTSAILGDDATFHVGVQGLLPTVNSGSLRLWLKADDGVVVSSNRVTQWEDRSNNTNDCFQAD